MPNVAPDEIFFQIGTSQKPRRRGRLNEMSLRVTTPLTRADKVID